MIHTNYLASYLKPDSKNSGRIRCLYNNYINRSENCNKKRSEFHAKAESRFVSDKQKRSKPFSFDLWWARRDLNPHVRNAH